MLPYKARRYTRWHAARRTTRPLTLQGDRDDNDKPVELAHIYTCVKLESDKLRLTNGMHGTLRAYSPDRSIIIRPASNARRRTRRQDPTNGINAIIIILSVLNYNLFDLSLTTRFIQKIYTNIVKFISFLKNLY